MRRISQVGSDIRRTLPVPLLLIIGVTVVVSLALFIDGVWTGQWLYAVANLATAAAVVWGLAILSRSTPPSSFDKVAMVGLVAILCLGALVLLVR